MDETTPTGASEPDSPTSSSQPVPELIDRLEVSGIDIDSRRVENPPVEPELTCTDDYHSDLALAKEQGFVVVEVAGHEEALREAYAAEDHEGRATFRRMFPGLFGDG